MTLGEWLRTYRERYPDPHPRCSTCHRDAACFGVYEGIAGYGCDECCGHGCEDGHCERLGDDWYDPDDIDADEYDSGRWEEEPDEPTGSCDGCGVDVYDGNDLC